MEMKYNKKKIMLLWTALICGTMTTSCMKDFLDVKRNRSQVIPVTLEDYRAILDNQNMNFFSPHLLAEIGSDDYYIQDEHWMSLTDPVEKNAYIWADEVYQGQPSVDWNRGYEKILYANFVLEGVGDIEETPANKSLRDELLGSARFYRASSLYQLAQLFCTQYDANTADSDLGLPLRTTSNINITFPRASLNSTYGHIITDLEEAVSLLPHNRTLITRPSRTAALCMLAKVYLQMGDYGTSFRYAEEVMSADMKITDFNGIDPTQNFPFPLYGVGNEEVVFYSNMSFALILSNVRLKVDSVLYQSYSDLDVRKQAFFFTDGLHTMFKGSYTGQSTTFFSGLTFVESLLIHAECAARLGYLEIARNDMDRLLRKRYEAGRYENIPEAIGKDDLLNLILLERRKELVYRGVRWHDLKRFGKDPELATPLQRTLGEITYILSLNSPKWVWPIPPDVVSLGNIQQNER